MCEEDDESDCCESETDNVWDRSGFPVRFFNGEVILRDTDVAAAASPISQARSYSNRLAGNYSGPLGNNWVVPGWTYLVQETSGNDDVIIYVQGQNRIWFDKSGSTFTARYGAAEDYQLVQSGSEFKLSVQAPRGITTQTFFDFSSAATTKGMLKSRVNSYGKTTTVESYTGQAIGELQCALGGVTWSLDYTFYAAGAHTGRVEYATLRKSLDSGSTWSDIRRAKYEYYTGDEPANQAYGTSNDLKLVTVQADDSGSWGDASKTYYRWYKNGESNGFVGGLKYVVGAQAYAEMLADSQTPETASNEDVAAFADHYFEYDSDQKVTKEIAQNCVSCSGGSGTGGSGETMSRTESANADGYNSWRWKVVVTKSNGNVETVYTNHLGQTMLTDLQESSVSSRRWMTYTKYGESGGSLGKKIETANAAAVISFDDTQPDLNVTLQASQGMITYTTYGSSTTASGNTLGDVLSYPKQIEISEGTSGTKIKQQTRQYKTSTDSGQSVYVVGKETRYRNDDGTGAIETSYDYLWYTSPVVSMKQRTTTLPVVSTGQHGDGVAATTKRYFDADGKVTFSQDERGIVTKNTFDDATDQLIKTEVDVDSSVSGFPSGWTVGGTAPHLKITTDFSYDDLGRRTGVLGPEHEAVLGGSATDIRTASWTVYKEAVSGNQSWRGNGYRQSSDSSDTLIAPVSITMFDKSGRPTDQIQTVRSTGTGRLSGTDTFLRDDWTSWAVDFYNPQGNKVTSRVYHAIAPQSPDLGLAGVDTDPGTEHTNYEETHFGYNADTDLAVRKVTPDGTITRFVYDGINRLEQTWMGTDDTPTSGTWKDWSPTNTAGANLVKITENAYDDGSAGGVSNLTSVQNWVDGSSIRETKYLYDFRSRRVLSIGEESSCTKTVYDNLSQAYETTQHDGCTGSPPTPGTLLGKQATSFDDRGRVYQSERFAVNPSTGAAGNATTASQWYDAGQLVTKSIGHGQGDTYTRNEYDNLGRQIVSLTGYGNVAAPDDEVVVDQQQTVFDNASNATETTLIQRDTDTPVASPTFRTSYSFTWYDGIDRSFSSASYGTNGGSAPTRPSVPPSSSDTVLVTTTAYNDAGQAYSTTDAAGTESRRYFDAMGRVTSQVDNYQTSGSGSDINNTTEFTYTADSQQKTLTVKMSAPADDEVTTYIYGVTQAGGSGLDANNLLLATEYPEDTSTKREEYQYNRLGQRIQKTDQNGTVHSYDFDGLGRQTQDRVTTLGSGVDATVRRIGMTYNSRGMVSSIASFDNAVAGSGTVLNEVETLYNDFSQITTEYLAHSGAVNTSTSPNIQYAHASGASSSNRIRPTSVTYPSSRQIDFNYGVSGGENDSLNRVFAVTDGATNLAEYKYLGGRTFTQVDYTQPSVKMDLWGGTAGTYDGLDRFGRIIDLAWQQHSGSPVDLVRIQYGYNRVSSPTYARDEVGRTSGADVDQLYAYDGMQRLIDFQQGLLNGTNTGVTNKTLTQDWDLDQVGNWDGFDQGITNVLNQTRTHNKVNEITGISESSGQPQWVTPSYDDAGNTTLMPQPADPTKKYDVTYDAWNRITKVQSTNGQTTLVAQYDYDGRNHRLSKKVYDGTGSLESTTKFFYNTAWQCLEEQTTPVVGTATTTEYVWGKRYIDDLILRDIGSDRLYAMQDRQFKVVALTDTSGTVTERYVYTPYGDSEIYSSTFVSRSSSHYDWEYRYTSRRLDLETGLYYFRNRYYDTGLGRFCSRDPIGFEGSKWNLYGAFLGLGAVDPTGLVPQFPSGTWPPQGPYPPQQGPGPTPLPPVNPPSGPWPSGTWPPQGPYPPQQGPGPTPLPPVNPPSGPWPSGTWPPQGPYPPQQGPGPTPLPPVNPPSGPWPSGTWPPQGPYPPQQGPWPTPLPPVDPPPRCNRWYPSPPPTQPPQHPVPHGVPYPLDWPSQLDPPYYPY